MTRLRLICGVLLAVVCLQMYPCKADATESRPSHNPNGPALWTCAATRFTEEQTVTHAHPVAMGTYASGVSYLRASCTAWAENLFCSWVGEYRTNDVHFVYSGPACRIIN